MSFTNEQISALQAPLNRANVKSRSQAGRALSYIEGWKAIEEANRIFGFDKWDRETVELRECGEPRQVGDKWRVAFMCRVRIRVRPAAQMDIAWSVIRDGIGYGSGIDKDLGQAFESAIKEAETDAMKRALMTFGNPFGLALYDKDQANVVDMRNQQSTAFDHPQEEGPSGDDLAQEFIAECETKILNYKDPIALKTWWNSPAFIKECGDFNLSGEEVATLKAKMIARGTALSQKAAA